MLVIVVQEEFSRARVEKDKNFDGKFFFAVKTTGIFCKPSCPSPVAKEKNVLYFSTMFEALEDGFRPCRRCRPDITTEYYGTDAGKCAVVKQALKLIYDGYLNDNSLHDLADKLGVSERHLRNVFVDSLGTPPVKVARYHKAIFAKKLLESSNQSMADIAFASGFGSIRQFNQTVKEIFGKTPTAIRKESTYSFETGSPATLYLPYDHPFDFLHILSFMRPRAMRGVELVTEDAYSRTFRVGNASGYFSVRDCPEKCALALSIVSDDVTCFMEIHNRVRQMFDLDTEFTAINDRFAKDEVLSKGMEKGHAPRLPRAFDPFEFIVRAILGQQVTVKAATTLAGRIADRAGVGTNNDFPDGLNFFFPTPTELLEADLNQLGITQARLNTIVAVATAIQEGKLSLSCNQQFESFYKDFSSVKGIGDWTVNYVAMRGLGMIDSFPASDLGVIKALMQGESKPKHKQIVAMGEKWRPYRAYATLCLWNSLGKEI